MQQDVEVLGRTYRAVAVPCDDRDMPCYCTVVRFYYNGKVAATYTEMASFSEVVSHFKQDVEMLNEQCHVESTH